MSNKQDDNIHIMTIESEEHGSAPVNVYIKKNFAEFLNGLSDDIYRIAYPNKIMKPLQKRGELGKEDTQ